MNSQLVGGGGGVNKHLVCNGWDDVYFIMIYWGNYSVLWYIIFGQVVYIYVTEGFDFR